MRDAAAALTQHKFYTGGNDAADIDGRKNLWQELVSALAALTDTADGGGDE